MEFTKKIIKKYNNLFLEVAEFYNMKDMVERHISGLYYINIIHYGYDNENKSLGAILDYLHFMYPYISDFYKIFHHENFEITERDFNMINYSIKKIRKEKSHINNRS